LRALIADPDASRRVALEAELSRHGYDIDAREAAPETAEGFDLICLGGEDALAACRRVAGTDAIVILVGDRSALDAVEAGATDVWELRGGLDTRLQLAHHYARLQTEHVRIGGEFALLRQALDLAATGFILTDPRLEDNPIVYVNQSFLVMTGYAADEVLGRNCRFLQGRETDPARVEELRRATRERRPATVELRNYRKDGTPFWNEIHISPVRDERGEVVRFVGVQVDVSAYREEQRRLVREQTARVAAEAAERRSAFLAEASPQLDASLDLRSTLDSLTRLSVPFLADVCIVDELHLSDVRRLAAAATDPAVERLVRDLPSRYPVDPGDPIARVVESGRSEILTGSNVFGPAAAGTGRLLADFAQAALLVPLKARGRTLGIVVFASLDPARRYGTEDLLLAEDLARRAALALDNARLYEDLGDVARALQAALLPQRLPELSGVELAARFRPAGDGSLIGGDFYDVLPYDGGVDLVIGDVTGKGARAAALTSLVRHTVRTAARYEAAPSGVLDVVNRTLIAERSERGRYCTVAFCRFELEGSARATICCAGHPMPMVMRGSGAVEHVGQPGSVLGWVEDPKLLDVDFELAPHESLVLFTDGVTEARTTGDAYGLGGLERLLRDAVGEGAAGIAARVDRAAALAGERRDDVAVLVARRGGPAHRQTVAAGLDAEELAQAEAGAQRGDRDAGEQ
jgi:PAS domain S-box-containing protein